MNEEEVKISSKSIRNKISIVHEGDARTETVLFDCDHQTDTRTTYCSLCDSYQQKVLRFCKYRDVSVVEQYQSCYMYRPRHARDDGGLLILNARASMVAQGKPFTGSEEVAFKTFVAELENATLH